LYLDEVGRHPLLGGLYAALSPICVSTTAVRRSVGAHLHRPDRPSWTSWVVGVIAAVLGGITLSTGNRPGRQAILH
jgi:hypothetical protein